MGLSGKIPTWLRTGPGSATHHLRDSRSPVHLPSEAGNKAPRFDRFTKTVSTQGLESTWPAPHAGQGQQTASSSRPCRTFSPQS